MELMKTNAVKSTASIAGHPIHPILVPFPIAFFVGAFASDLAFLWTGDVFWARASLWLIGSGIGMAALAAVFGLTDFLTIARVREHTEAWVHFLGNGTVVVLQAISWYLRWSAGPVAVIPWGLAFSAAVTLLLLVTGWMGGELAYRYGIGVQNAACQLRLMETGPGERGTERLRRAA